MHFLIGGLLAIFALFITIPKPTVLGTNTIIELVQPVENPNLQPIKTESRFTEKLIEESSFITKKTVYKDNPEEEAGIDKVLEEGIDGKKTKIIKITYYEGKEYNQEVVGTETILAKDKVILRGTKIVWRSFDTADGEIKYWKKMRVWATHYDHTCLGCNEWTATGRKATKGVIAVDPKVIKLGTKVYVPGYGFAEAQDTGGAIKGNIIDLCFDDAKTSGWSARFVDIYLLN